MTTSRQAIPGQEGAARPRAIIVANVVPRWVSDFNEVSTRLVAAGYRVTLYASAPDPAATSGWRSAAAVRAAASELDPAIEVAFLPYSALRLGPAAHLRTLLLAVRLGWREPEALFVLWTTIPIVTWGPALHLMRRRVVYMVTGLGPVFAPGSPHPTRRRVLERVQKVLFSSSRCRVLVHNREDKAFLDTRYGLPPDRVVVTPGCGVDPARFPFADADPSGAREASEASESLGLPETPVILVPVRLLVDKGVLDAAEASRRLTDAGVDHEMWFTSNVDPTHPTALGAAEVARIEASTPMVRFLGYQDSLQALYRRSAVVCIPSYFPEGLQTALLEAASMGRPIVTCDNVGVRDFIRPGVDALVVAPRSPAALAQALARVLTDPALADRLRCSARDRFLSGFTKDDMVDLTVDAVEALGFAVPAGATTGGPP